MNFQEFIKRGLVRKTSPDPQLMQSLIKVIDHDLSFMETVKITELSARKVIGNYYDTLREILEVMALKGGFKVYAHEPFVAFLKENGKEGIAAKFDRFRVLRNNINYYGASISAEEAIIFKQELLDLITTLKKEL